MSSTSCDCACAFALDGLHCAAGGVFVQLSAGEQMRPAANGGYRSAQLVRQRREKFVFQPVQFVRLSEQPRVFDCRRDAARKFFHQRDVGLVVLAARFLFTRAKRNHANRPAADEQRYADVRKRPQLVPELEQLRIDVVRQPRDSARDLFVSHDHWFACFPDDLGKGGDVRRRWSLDHAADELANGRFFGADDVTTHDVPEVPLLVFDEDRAVIAQPRQREANDAIDCFVVVERRRQKRAHFSQEHQSIARGERVGEREALALEQLFAQPLGTAAFADVARNLRGANQVAGAVSDWRQRQGHIEPRSVLPHTLGFEMFHALACANTGKHLFFFAKTLRRDDQRHRLPDRFRRCISVQPFGAHVPRCDHPPHVDSDDRIVTRFNNGGELTLRELSAADRFVLGGELLEGYESSYLGAAEPVVEPCDDEADEHEARQQSCWREAAHAALHHRNERVRGGRRQGGCDDAGPEAAIPRGGDDRDEKREKRSAREGCRHHRPRGRRRDDRGDREGVSVQPADASRHRLEKGIRT